MDHLCDIRKLADLLKTENVSEDSDDDDLPSAGLSRLGPGHIGKEKTARTKCSQVNIRSSSAGDVLDHIKEPEKGSDKDVIWLQEEIYEMPTGEEHFDCREQPQYDIKFQQAVSPSDVYLQLGGKTAATASCENMVVTILLEGESKTAIDLTVTKTTLDIRSPLYRLQLHLPHSVDPDEGHAEWDQTKQSLTVTLRMVRTFDFINF